MEGVVKPVKRSEWYEGVANNRHTPENHSIRHTNTYATLDDGTNVCLDEKEILQSFNRRKFSDKLIKDLESKLVGRSINYKDIDGECHLDGSLSEYLNGK